MTANLCSDTTERKHPLPHRKTESEPDGLVTNRLASLSGNSASSLTPNVPPCYNKEEELSEVNTEIERLNTTDEQKDS